MSDHIKKIAAELSINEKQVSAVVELLNQDATIPFIARYRKEATGSLDEVAITEIRNRMDRLILLEKRREAIFSAMEERGQLTDEIREKMETAETLTELEDLYLPFRPKRRTRATIAREKGLEPLAEILFKQEEEDPTVLAEGFLDQEKGVTTVEEALKGAQDIMAEWMNEDQEARKALRELFLTQGIIRSRVIKGKETERVKYQDYFNWKEPVKSIPSHRLLAIRRGEKEMILSLRILPPEDIALSLLESFFVKGTNFSSLIVKEASQDCYKRLTAPSLENDVRLISKERADRVAIEVFSENLRQLLLFPPLGQKRVLAIDPGFRTGCKIVCLDNQGNLLQHDTIYPHPPQEDIESASKLVLKRCHEFNIECIAVGNGTAGRETEAFLRSLEGLSKIPIIMVNESGASVYSASEVARKEFPNQDVTVRGAVSIGRRLMDPLAELVKIDPKSIGVGQYQHDVDQAELKKSLDDVVISCVNSVGVEVNTASKELLSYVSGLGPQLAQAIVDYRSQNGPFRSRDVLKKVPRLGPKAFEQSAGFLRIRDGENPLDASAVHPESYPIIEQIANDLEISIIELIGKNDLAEKINLNHYLNDRVGLPTLQDILTELSKPGRDPRQQFEFFQFAPGVNSIEDLQIGMKLPGVITNITAFGAFVDIGVHQDGLVHISQLSRKYIKNPAEVVKVHQKVIVIVIGVDLERKRINLSMKEPD
ncbi:MAG: 30S ribosomal protein S1 [Candidatus Atribacteria bacterium ADurb.Bin276]|uniref:30S ribosomal protein S1 n=1 Tax=Candidatus Atribacter allofermentans TaxID=1852833 RepID=A0A1V5T280_9BACT|nr:MAG: 30S ribosomal protein S1 [Candidatus Atribacteria bacterium ADurb.Bin276]